MTKIRTSYQQLLFNQQMYTKNNDYNKNFVPKITFFFAGTEKRQPSVALDFQQLRWRQKLTYLSDADSAGMEVMKTPTMTMPKMGKKKGRLGQSFSHLPCSTCQYWEVVTSSAVKLSITQLQLLNFWTVNQKRSASESILLWNQTHLSLPASLTLQQSDNIRCSFLGSHF